MQLNLTPGSRTRWRSHPVTDVRQVLEITLAPASAARPEERIPAAA
ncbi:hypothetical protein [Streptomyces sp. NPDC047985]